MAIPTEPTDWKFPEYNPLDQEELNWCDNEFNEHLYYDIDVYGRVICLASDIPAVVCPCPRCEDRRDTAAAEGQ